MHKKNGSEAGTQCAIGRKYTLKYQPPVQFKTQATNNCCGEDNVATLSIRPTNVRTQPLPSNKTQTVAGLRKVSF